MHPFLDVAKLTDEEIIERLGRAYSYMNYQVALGHNATVISIKEVIQSLEDERYTRLNKTMADETERKFPLMNAPIDLGTIEVDKNPSKQPRDITIESLEEEIRKLL